MEKFQEDASQFKKKFTVQIGSRNSFGLGLSGVRLSKWEVICTGNRGRGSNLTPAATAAISSNTRDVVSQTFCLTYKKDKNRRAPAQPWPEGIISTGMAFF
jgi:hypothetical protein